MIGASLLLAIVFASQATAATFTATEGAPFSGALATANCVVSNTPTPPTITWGDGTISAASYPTPPGYGALSGTYTYAEEGTYSGSVSWTDDCGSHLTSFQMNVADATLSSSATSLTGQAGTQIVARVASFSDADPAGVAADYTATITWGDGAMSAGTISALSGRFAVNGSHIYTRAGSYTTTIAIHDAGGANTTANGRATVSPVPIPVVTGVNPVSGPTAGGTSVTIAGSSFTGTTGVHFGPNAGTNVKVLNSGQITAISPPGTGTVDVTVTTPNGTSTTNSADLFTYIAPAPPPPGSSPASAPAVSGGAPTTTTSSGAGVAGIVNPGGAPTTAYFEYGLDMSERGPGSSSTVYDQSTSPQQVGSDSLNHTVAASLTGLLPGALYHIRLVATNSAGTTFGLDQAFTTPQGPAPPPPVLGQSENVQPVTGAVFIRLPSGAFVKLTGNQQIPNGAEIDALGGSLKITTATAKKGKTQQGVFGGAVFKLTQASGGASRGLATLAIVEGAFGGAPSYASCKTHKALEATAASSRTLQLLHASAKGKFRTKGKYSAATVLGTIWTVADRCDGTLTHDVTDSVLVNDFVHHKTIVLHAGQSYLAKAPGKHP
jgi:hypothetical protein